MPGFPSYPDIPDHDDIEIATIRLNRMPMHLLVSPGHPLLNLGDSITVPRWLAIRAWPDRRGPSRSFRRSRPSAAIKRHRREYSAILKSSAAHFVLGPADYSSNARDPDRAGMP